MAEKNEKSGETVKYHVPNDLDYSYRDVCNVYVGPGDVLLEFGNKHRSMPGNITISNRITLTIANAYALQQTLQKALDAAQSQLQQQMQKK